MGRTMGLRYLLRALALAVFAAVSSAPAVGDEFRHGGWDANATVDQAGLNPVLNPVLGPALDIETFSVDLRAALDSRVSGYFMGFARHGRRIATAQMDLTRMPADGRLNWGPASTMHIASVSKLITAMAMTRLLAENNISPDTPIIAYLPVYWHVGPNIGDITFRHLLTHKSGFSTGSSRTSYALMKRQVAAGIEKTGVYDYENMNFGLCRILMAVINGDIPRSLYVPTLSATLNDQIWNTTTINAYDHYVKDEIFAPAGVTAASLLRPENSALAYDFPVGDGWNSGDLQSMAGAAGWHMSPIDLLRVMAAFRRGGDIVSQALAERMLEDGFGIDGVLRSRAGNVYVKTGLWRDRHGRTEQVIVYFLPGEQELVIYVNSPIGPVGLSRGSLIHLVKDLYLANI